MAVPEEFAGRAFVQVATMVLRNRGDRKSCLVLGIQRGDDMMLNPIGQEAGPLRAGDQLILMSRVFLDPSQPIPTAAGRVSDEEEDTLLGPRFDFSPSPSPSPSSNTNSHTKI